MAMRMRSHGSTKKGNNLVFGLRYFRARAFNQRLAIRHCFLYWSEKSPAQEKIEKQNDNDRGHSFEKQIAKLVEKFHRKNEI